MNKKNKLMGKMKQNKNISLRKHSNKQLWTTPMLKIAVKKGQMTKQEFKNITGEVYSI